MNFIAFTLNTLLFGAILGCTIKSETCTNSDKSGEQECQTTTVDITTDTGTSSSGTSPTSEHSPSTPADVEPPKHFTYEYSQYAFMNGFSDISLALPVLSQSEGATYSISPALPAGMILDTATGEVGGTPSAISPATDYTITQTRSDGKTDSFTVNIRVLNGFVVDSTEDEIDANLGDGVCFATLATGPTQCSFRAAVMEADQDAEEEMIYFTGTHVIGTTEMNISNHIWIMGSGTVSAILDGNADSRILRFESANRIATTNFTVTNVNPDAEEGGALRLIGPEFYAGHVNFENGDCTGDEDGCGFYIDGSPNFLVEYSNYSGNQAVWDSAIWIHNSTGSARHLNILGNSALTEGAGITVTGSSSVVILDSINFENNTALGTGDIGALKVDDSATVTISNSTFKNNNANDQGGAVGALSSGNLTIINSAFIDNSSASNGAGIYAASSATVEVYNSWFANNMEGGAGSIDHCHAASASVTIYFSVFDSIDTGCTIEPSSSASADFKLGTYDYHNGFIKTYSLLAGSPLLDASTSAECPLRDSRSYLRDINVGGSAICDIGPYEFHP